MILYLHLDWLYVDLPLRLLERVFRVVRGDPTFQAEALDFVECGHYVETV